MSVEGKALKKSNALIPAAVASALGASSFNSRTCDISDDDHRALVRLLKPDVDTWRQEFASRLRSAASDLLALTHSQLQDIPPAARAYTLAVLVDKASAIEGRSSLQGAQVNLQINNFSSSSSKASILDALEGRISPINASQAPDISSSQSPINATPPTPQTL